MPRSPLSRARDRAEAVFLRRVRLAMTALRDGIVPARLLAGLRDGPSAALDAIPFALFERRLLTDAMRVFRDIYETAGDLSTANIKAQLVGKASDYEARVDNHTFDVLNDRGLRFLQRHAGERIVGIVTATRDAIRAVISDMTNQGVPVTQQAVRVRDYVGLTEGHARAVENLRADLIDRGVAPARIQVLTARKAKELRDLRALNIARTEAGFASFAGFSESISQAVEEDLLDRATATRVWLVSADEETCPICEPMADQEVGLDEPFVTGEGDEIDGYPAHVNCRCDVVVQVN
jgi:hypothetical protein